MTIEVEQANFLLRYTAEVILGFIVVLAAILKLLGRRAQADSLKASALSPSITKVEMLECQMEITTLIREEFDKFRAEMRDKINIIHRRIDDIDKPG